MQNTYWNKDSKYNEQASVLEKLVPTDGKCATFKGEVWRAVTKIYYDYHNNGWGNHWKAPAAFLMTHIDLDEALRRILFDHANGNMHDGGFQAEMEQLVDAVVVQLRTVEDRPNTVDMWEFEGDWEMDRKFEEEQTYDEDDEDDNEEWSADTTDYCDVSSRHHY
jgi:hypothetical protein